MTQFEIDSKEEKSINLNGKNVSYWNYQLTVHHFNLKLMVKGMKVRNVTLAQLKRYYGLKGNKNLLEQFETIKNNFEKQ
jgi:hypothetical protein